MLDTSVLTAGSSTGPGLHAAISSISLGELHFGLLVARDDDVRAQRAIRLGAVEARFPDPLPVDDRVAREWGRLQAAVAKAGGKPRARMADLVIAATANVHGAVLLTHNLRDFNLVSGLVDVREPRT